MRARLPDEREARPLLHLLLLPCAFAEDELTVSPATGPQPGSTAASLTVLPLGPDLPPGQDLASVVDSASGTTVRRLGGLGDFSAVSLRGSTFRQVEVFLDGLPLNPDGASAVNLSELPVSAFDRVEIYRGMAPVAFGSGAIGGVLNLVTPTRAVPATVGARAGSFGTFATSAVVGPKRGAVDALLAIDQLHTEGDFPYFDDQGTEYTLLDDRTPTRVNNAIDRASLLGRVRFGPHAARVTLLESFVGSHQELPGPISAASQTGSLGTVRNLVGAGVDVSASPTLRVLPQAWWLWRQEVFDDRDAAIGVGAQHTRDRSGTVGGQTSVVWAPVTWATGSALLRGRHERYTPYDLLADTDDGDRARTAGVAALGADLRFWDDRVTVSPAAQVELLDDRAIGTVPWEGVDIPDAAVGVWPTPRIGALVRPWPWLSLKGTAGTYLRVPDLTELFGDRGTMQGNPALLPETGEAWEVGVRAEAPWEGLVQGSVDAAYARRTVHDLIAWVQNSQQTQYPINVGEAYVRSTEAAVTVHVGGYVTSQSNLTWTVTRNLLPDPAYANNALPGIPDLELNQATTVRWPERAALTHTWSYTGLTFTDTANVGFTAPRDLHALALELTPVPGLPSVRAEVLNLFDVRGTAVDRNPLDDGDDTPIVRPLTDFSGYPLPGRTVMVAVSWTETPRK